LIELLLLISVLAQSDDDYKLQEYAEDWWQWIVSIPRESNPEFDQTGELTEAANKYNEQYFLAAGINQTNPPLRHITITQNTSLFFPAIIGGYADTQSWSSQITDFVTGTNLYDKLLKSNHIHLLDPTKDIHAILDGKPIPVKRITTTVYNVNYIEDNVFKVPYGNHPTVVDGYWVYIESLPKGKHTLHFGGATPPAYFTTVIYYITVI
jgi:hypothetical protein